MNQSIQQDSLINNLSYKIGWICGLIAMIYFGIFFYIDAPLLSLGAFLSASIYFFSVILNKVGKEISAKYIIIVNSNLTVFSYSYILGEQSGIHLAFFFLPIMHYTLLCYEDRKYNLIIFTMVSILLYGALGVHFELNNSLYFNNALINRLIFFTASTATIVISLLCVTVLIGEIKKVNQRLTIKNRDLQTAYGRLKKSREAQSLLTDQAEYAKLVQGIAHEFKNPLHLMQGLVEIELDNSKHTKRLTNVFNTLLQTIFRLNNLMLPLITYLKGKSEKYNFKNVDINQLIDHIVLLSDGRCKKQNISISVSKLCDTTMVTVDEHSIAQVFINIISNAIDAIGSNGDIKISLKEGELLNKNEGVTDCVEIHISDTGKGIEKDKLQTIFLPYQSGKKDADNIGLGLSISSKIIFDHNGLILVGSEVSKGTTFKIKLPKTNKDCDLTQADDKDALSKDFSLKDDFFLS